MTPNEGTLDRIVRSVLALVLFYLALRAQGPWNGVLGLLGAVLLFTAITGFCGLYRLLGISTCRRSGPSS